MPVFEKVEFYYSSVYPALDQYRVDLNKVLDAIEKMKDYGIEAFAIDVETLEDTFRIYHKAISVLSEEENVFLKVSGNYSDLFGRQIPVLLCFKRANDNVPEEVFPKFKGSRIVSIEEAIDKIMAGKLDY